MLIEETKTILEQEESPAAPGAFTAAELIKCGACSRANPPNRENCLYCGFGLKVTPEHPRQKETVAQTVEPSNANYIVIASRNEHIDEDQLKEVAALVGKESSDVTRAFAVARVIPIFATQSQTNAEAISRELKSRGIESAIIGEDQIAATTSIEVRTLELGDESVTAIGERGQRQPSVSWSDLSLIVAGHLHFISVEVEQKPKKSSRKIVAERRLSTDAAVIDIYRRNETSAWRIKSNSFDFSCLGERKAITAFENFSNLIDLVRQRANGADFNDDYVRLRPLLDMIWPAENSEQPRQRRRAGWRELEATVTHAHNTAQFDLYSRLLQRLSEQI